MRRRKNPAASGSEKAAAGGESGPLKEVSTNFAPNAAKWAPKDEDLETHYNLGIAFREMGFWKRPSANFRNWRRLPTGQALVRHAIAAPLLGLAFMEKGQPGSRPSGTSARSDTRHDTESKLALRYDLGVPRSPAGEQARHSRALPVTRSNLITATCGTHHSLQRTGC